MSEKVTPPIEAPIKPSAPQHAFEVRISIGAHEWRHVLDALDEIILDLREMGPRFSCSSGGWGGCHSVDVQQRNVTPERYREELAEWAESRREGTV